MYHMCQDLSTRETLIHQTSSQGIESEQNVYLYTYR
jgi:hypothetical protein